MMWNDHWIINFAAIGLVLTPCTAFCQNPGRLPEFEAVSIKPNTSKDRRSMLRPLPGGRLTAANVTLKQLIAWAYQVRESQVSGKPTWVDSERFDVATKSDGDPGYDYFNPELQTMFQGVLQDRCKLQLHRITKQLEINKLVVAKGGLKITVDEASCPEDSTLHAPCHYVRPSRFAQLSAEKAPMSALAWMLTRMIGKMVVDDTQVKGNFTYTLDWEKYVQPPELPPGVVAPPGAFDPRSFGPAITSALEKQLGLELNPGEGPVEILVIDHIEPPSAN